MRRIETATGVAYVGRPWKASVGLFAAGTLGIALGAAFGAPGRMPEPVQAIFTYSWLALLAAIVLQYQRKVLVIDGDSGSANWVERRFLCATTRRTLSLSVLRVTTNSVLQQGLFRDGRRFWIWLESPGVGPMLFAGPLRSERRFGELLDRLRQDLRGS